MFKWLFWFGLLIVFVVGCAKPNYLEEDEYVIISEPENKNDSTKIKKDTSSTVLVDGEGKLYFDIDLNDLKVDSIGDTSLVLSKRSAVKVNKLALTNFRKGKSSQVYVVLSDSLKKEREYYFLLKDGKCSGQLSIPVGYKYEIVTYLRYAVTCPWDTSYQLIDAPFFARDTVDFRSLSSATLDLSFKEVTALSFFFELANPSGSYVEGGKYYVLESVGRTGRPAFYQGGKLKHWLYIGNLNVNTASVRVVDSKNDTINLGLSFNLDTYVSNNCLVSMGDASVKIGTIDFDYQKALTVVDAAPYYGGIKISYNKTCDIYPDSTQKLRIYKMVGADSVRIDTLGTLTADIGFIWWHKKSPIEHLEVGNYAVRAGINFAKDEYDFKQITAFARTLTVTASDIPKP